ncbi:MAG: hypothetical protein R3F11_09010 [Verrucomicrobiales bacterium]
MSFSAAKPAPDAYGVNPKQARFLELWVLDGRAQKGAYAAAFDKAEDDPSLTAAASQCAARAGCVAYRRALQTWLRESCMTVPEKRRILAEIARSECDRSDPCAPTYAERLRAMAEDSKLAGHYPDPEDREAPGGTVAGMSSRLIDLFLAKATEGQDRPIANHS